MRRFLPLVIALAACSVSPEAGPSGDDVAISDTGSNPDARCDDTPLTPPVGAGPEACHTAELFCGDQITHTTVGGAVELADGYSSGGWGCVGSDPLASSYDGPERRYYFEAPSGIEPTATLTSRCDLTMKIVQVSVGTCPTDQSSVDCWDAQGAYTDLTQSHTFFPGFAYEIIVESVDGSQGAFTIDIDC